MAMTYRVTHRTEYRYEQDVEPGYSELRALPRDLPGQRCRSTEVIIEPEPRGYRERRDFFGNRVAQFSLLEPHRFLRVTAVSVVDVDRGAERPGLFADRPWQEVRDEAPAGPLDVVQFLDASPLVPLSERWRAYAAACFPPGRSLVGAATDLCHTIHRDFTYEPGSTSVGTTVDELYERRIGVCQDFTHVMIACLRSMGLSARYVSGYLHTAPPPDGRKRLGADASHAWVSVYLPETGWIDLDPTNDQMVDDGYVTTAWGRDYSDVPPLKGVVFTEGTTMELDVVVDVMALHAPVSGT